MRGSINHSSKRARPLRVLMTADTVGGVWQYAIDLARGLAPHDVATALAIFGPPPLPDQLAAAEAAGVALIDAALPLEWTAQHVGEVEEAGHALAGIAAEQKPDIIHLNNPALVAIAHFPVPVLAVCHSCLASWWEAVRSGPLPEDFAWRVELVRRGYRAADALVAPTAAFAHVTAKLYRPSHPPDVVHNGRRTFLSDSSGDPPEEAVFTAGRLWDEGKNLISLDRAAARLSIPVRAAGPIEGPNGVRISLQHVAALGRLGDAEIARWLARRPIFASTARYEPFGLAVLEAAQAGCALVLSDIPTFRELWDGAAIFVPGEDDEAVAHAIEHLLRDPGVRAKLGRKAREWSKAYTVEAMSGGILRLYRSLLRGAGNPVLAQAAA